MSVGKDDAAITDAYIALSPTGGPETQIPTGKTFYVVVKAEAGTNAMLGGLPYNIRVILQDISTFTTLFNAPQSGNLAVGASAAVPPFSTVPAWTTANSDVTFVITVPVKSGPVGTIYRIRGFVLLGAAERDISTFESELVLVSS